MPADILRAAQKRSAVRAALLLALLALSGIFTSASAQTIYRCDQQGKTIFSDKPCGPTKNVQQGPSISQPESRVYSMTPVSGGPYGDWRGQAQYQATIGRDIDPKAHTVTDLTISIDPQGKVVGASPGNGCKLLGVASPGYGPNILNLDVTFSRCQYAAFNRRFSGNLSLRGKPQYVTLSLTSSIVQIGGPVTMFDVRATMRR